MRNYYERNVTIPTVVETRDGKEGRYDIYSKLLNNRIIFLDDEVNSDTAGAIIAQLLHLNFEDNEKVISLYINSPGGCVVSGTQIVDTMRYIKAPVATIVTGYACSMGFVIATSGEPGMRFALPNAQFMAHQVSSGARGHVKDMTITVEHSKKLNDAIYTIMADNIGINKKKFLELTERDVWFNAEEAKAFGKKGIIDEIRYKQD